jgi:hypothetical protein
MDEQRLVHPDIVRMPDSLGTETQRLDPGRVAGSRGRNRQGKRDGSQSRGSAAHQRFLRRSDRHMIWRKTAY